jgi:hypothetical protein
MRSRTILLTAFVAAMAVANPAQATIYTLTFSATVDSYELNGIYDGVNPADVNGDSLTGSLMFDTSKFGAPYLATAYDIYAHQDPELLTLHIGPDDISSNVTVRDIFLDLPSYSGHDGVIVQFDINFTTDFSLTLDAQPPPGSIYSDPAVFTSISGFSDLAGSFTINTGADVVNWYVPVTLSLTSNSAPTGVPEPITLSIFGAGLFGAAAMRRRKAKRA